MATRLATTRNNFITVTQVKNDDDTDGNNSSNIGNNSTEIQRTQITPVALHHVNLSQKKIILQTAPSGSVSVIDVVPLESSDSSDSQIIVAEPITSSPNSQTNGQQVTAQVAVVQAQGSPNGQQFITFSGKILSAQDGSYVQYVDSELYATTSGQDSSQMTYPVYAVGDYTPGQQYYAATASNFTSNSSNGSGNNSSSYIVPVEDTILGVTTSRGSPQTLSADVAFIQGQQGTSSSSSTSGTSANSSQQQQQHSENHKQNNIDDSTPNLTHATRVSPATVAWLVENYETAEGVSLPRSTLYNHYMRHCNEQKLDAVNAASFGKLIRSVFTGLRTRRLGTRGNSKYHYYGIRIKPGSSLLSTTVDEKPSSNSSQYGNSSSSQTTPSSSGRKKFKPNPEPFETCAQFLGDGSHVIPAFPPIDLPHSMTDEATLDDVDTLKAIYREHLEAFLDAVLNLEFNTIESLWREFWRAQDNNNLDECEEEKYLSKMKLFNLCQSEPIQNFMKQVDLQFYQNMVDVLIPDVLRPIPSTLTQSIRNFAKNLENWLTSAMMGCPEDIIQIKLKAVSAFSQTLRRYTSLNHLAQAARAVLHNTTQITQMLNDLNRVDFHNVQEQASWVCQCDSTTVQRLESEFKAALQQQNSLEQWATWLRHVVDQALEDYRGKVSYVKAARQFLLKWSFYSSMVIRDLTLRSAASFGSFHLIRLLYDEYMFYILERKIAEETNTQPIAVMFGEHGLHITSGNMSNVSDGISIYHSDEFTNVKVESCKSGRH
ncbi:DNA-binding protein RFX2 isoform X2 [Chironomus tepperi]|uniref:DNA-binding protein RFX2 isoform X2 n=1 Tax=Chironomus tepperi TaxID=113505 RepID=UPI00391F154D